MCERESEREKERGEEIREKRLPLYFKADH